MAWDETKPADDEKIRNLGTVIRANWDAIEQAESGFQPWAVNLIDRTTVGAAPNTPTNIANTGILYTNTVSGNVDLFYEDAAGNPVQLTRADQTSIAANGYTFLPGGLILQWFTVAVTTGANAVTFPLTFPSAVYNVTSGWESGSTGNAKWSAITTAGFTATVSNNGTLHVQAIGI